LLKTEKGTFDFAFVDADKLNYPVYFTKIVDLLRPGNFINLEFSHKKSPGRENRMIFRDVSRRETLRKRVSWGEIL
ncbi:MAG: hypothetical protein JKY92_03620, partial [Magnetovibrio sp.]|nr:hypothetical protein [Magnetovibrio sp.]